MRPPRVRFTVQRMMAAVVVVALVLGAWVFGEKRGIYLKQAAVYGQQEQTRLARAARWEFEAARLRTLRTRPVPRSVNDTEDRYQARVDRWARSRALSKERDQFKLRELDGDAKGSRQAAAYFAGLRRKYERAASRPWLSVPADPPAPLSVRIEPRLYVGPP